MEPLSHCFMIFTLCGFWRPKNWSRGWKMVLYNCYTAIMVSFLYTFTILQFVNLVGDFENIEQFTSGSFMLLTMTSVCGKAANLLSKRHVIIQLTNILQNDICKPRNTAEIQIQNEYDRSNRFNILWYGALTITGLVSKTVSSFIIEVPQRILPFKLWLPSSCYTSLIGFWIAYFHQTISHFICGILNSGYDTLVPGLLMQACGQINILKYRLEDISKELNASRDRCSYTNEQEYQKECQLLESEMMADCVRHHLQIFQFVEKTRDIFGLVVFFQYSISSIVICFSVYEISKITEIGPEFAATLLYLACMLTQIFNFCFYGGEITLQSMEICDAVYRMEWFSFGNITKKSLITMMLRSLRPITFTCGSIITLSLDSFSSLIKLSYSTYNVLQQSR